MVFSSTFTSSAKYKCIEMEAEKTVEFNLAYCGREECNRGHRFGPNKRIASVLHIVTGGYGALEINNTVYHLSTGDAFYLEDGKEAYYQADWKEPWSYIWIGMTGFRVRESLLNAGFSGKTPVRKIKNIHKFEQYIDGILSTNGKNIESDFARRGYLMLFISDLITEYKNNYPVIQESGTGKSAESYTKYLADYISTNFNTPIRFQSIAEEMGVNRSYLTNSFTKCMGCSPQEFLLDVRMENAKSLLKESDLQIRIIANKVGYQDHVGFTKKFKQYYKCTPKEYRTQTQIVKFQSEKQEYSGYGL